MKSRELRVCGRRGHITYAPSETELADRLRTQTSLGEAWRCLRCGTWVLGPALASGPAAEAPVPERGKALRQRLILRLLAIERVIRALILIAAGYGVWRFESAQTALRGSFGRLVPAAKPLADQLGLDLDRSAFVADLDKVLNARAGTLTLVAVALFAYGLLELLEGIGLWLARRWGEYLAAVATAAFLPYEIYELARSVTVTKVVAIAINIAAVVYLVLAKRLFGARGGREAYERELQSESLLEVTAAGREPQFSNATPGSDVGM